MNPTGGHRLEKKKKGSKREVGHFKESRHHVTNQKSININKINVCHMGLLPAWNPSLQHKRYSVAQSLDKKKKGKRKKFEHHRHNMLKVK